ncbi:hypothetical protein Scep_005273 [Stephania cephalantha]|uniref:Uncharacterized protein n=1 Tax=Stephania cephalantha TaxID=152367 RepID=A0AAP0KWW9_9MAGN
MAKNSEMDYLYTVIRYRRICLETRTLRAIFPSHVPHITPSLVASLLQSACQASIRPSAGKFMIRGSHLKWHPREMEQRAGWLEKAGSVFAAAAANKVVVVVVVAVAEIGLLHPFETILSYAHLRALKNIQIANEPKPDHSGRLMRDYEERHEQTTARDRANDDDALRDGRQREGREQTTTRRRERRRRGTEQTTARDKADDGEGQSRRRRGNEQTIARGKADDSDGQSRRR